MAWSEELKLGIWLSGLQGWIKHLCYFCSKYGELGSRTHICQQKKRIRKLPAVEWEWRSSCERGETRDLSFFFQVYMHLAEEHIQIKILEKH